MRVFQVGIVDWLYASFKFKMAHCYDGITEVCTIVQGCLPEICCNEDPPIPLTWQKNTAIQVIAIHTTQ